MIRFAMEQLIKWKGKKRCKPLIIRGTRQVGKTWLMKEFGQTAYTQTVYINFDSNERMKTLFSGSFSVELLQKGDFEMAATFKQDYTDLLKHYYCVGGMPEVVQTFADNRDFKGEVCITL